MFLKSISTITLSILSLDFSYRGFPSQMSLWLLLGLSFREDGSWIGEQYLLSLPAGESKNDLKDFKETRTNIFQDTQFIEIVGNLSSQNIYHFAGWPSEKPDVFCKVNKPFKEFFSSYFSFRKTQEKIVLANYTEIMQEEYFHQGNGPTRSYVITLDEIHDNDFVMNKIWIWWGI